MVVARRQSSKDATLTLDELKQMAGKDQGPMMILQARIRSYARRSNAKGLQNLLYLERLLIAEIRVQGEENRKREAKRDALLKHAVKRISQALDLSDDPILREMRQYIQPGAYFDSSKLFTALAAAGDAPDLDFFITDAIEAGEENQRKAFEAGDYHRMNRIGEGLVALDKALETLRELNLL